MGCEEGRRVRQSERWSLGFCVCKSALVPPPRDAPSHPTPLGHPPLTLPALSHRAVGTRGKAWRPKGARAAYRPRTPPTTPGKALPVSRLPSNSAAVPLKRPRSWWADYRSSKTKGSMLYCCDLNVPRWTVAQPRILCLKHRSLTMFSPCTKGERGSAT